jgi:hypothetical protein
MPGADVGRDRGQPGNRVATMRAGAPAQHPGGCVHGRRRHWWPSRIRLLTMIDYRITGLPARLFADVQRATDDELQRRGVERVVVAEPDSAPCRISLEDAAVGEEVLLLNFRHLEVATPYAASGPIFIRRSATQAFDAINVVPQQQRRRLLSVRAFDATDHMVDAEVSPGSELEALIERFLAEPRVAYLHVHNARRGCYACRVDRA